MYLFSKTKNSYIIVTGIVILKFNYNRKVIIKSYILNFNRLI